MEVKILRKEFAKSRAMRASVVYVSTCPCTNVPKTYQLLIFTCQRAKGMPILQPRIPTCQHAKAFQFINLACQHAERRANFSTVAQKKTFLNFSIMLKFCKFQEYLGNSKKFISGNKKVPQL